MTDEPNANREIIDSSRGHVDAIDVIDVTDVDVIDAKYNALDHAADQIDDRQNDPWHNQTGIFLMRIKITQKVVFFWRLPSEHHG